MSSSDEPKRMKRIEYRGKHLRASRTGGLSLRAQTKAAGVNLTVNSRHGLRVSKRIAKGTNIALQNGHLRIQGRYGKGPTKLNVSKSGFSISTKNELGTFNWIKPRYSSATIAGINVRGRNALMVYAIWGIWKVLLGTVVLALNLLTAIVRLIWKLVPKGRSSQATSEAELTEDSLAPGLVDAVEATEASFQSETEDVSVAVHFLGMLGILLRPDDVPLTRELIDEARQATLDAAALPPCLDALDADTLLARVQVEGPLLTRWATHTQLSYPTVHDEVLLAHCAERIEREVGGDAWLEHFLWLDGWLETQSEDPAFAAERLWIIARATGVEVEAETTP